MLEAWRRVFTQSGWTEPTTISLEGDDGDTTATMTRAPARRAGATKKKPT